jgi:hypothetical protein
MRFDETSGQDLRFLNVAPMPTEFCMGVYLDAMKCSPFSRAFDQGALGLLRSASPSRRGTLMRALCRVRRDA